MRITVAERLQPFSHVPGTHFVLPRTFLSFQIFPALIRIYDLSDLPALVSEIPLNISGPVNDFTIQQNLERGEILVWGQAPTGFMRYRIFPTSTKTFDIAVEKEPAQKIFNFVSQNSQSIALNMPQERLSLGSHKAQDWTMLGRRCEMADIFPLWYRLGLITPDFEPMENNQNGSLINLCHLAIAERRIQDVVPAFRNLFLAGFDEGLSPRLMDTQHQGFVVPPLIGKSALKILTQGARLIRSLFLQVGDNVLHILPALPPEFHCGRFIQVSCEGIGVVDIEWSKKLMRRMVLKAEHDVNLQLIFQKELKQFRLRQKESDKGQQVPCGEMISVVKGQTYLLDRFEK